MRFVPTFCLREGMTLGKSLRGSDGTLLLQEGQIIKATYIEKIHQIGYQGVYIQDDLSRDIEIESVIDDELRFSAIKAIKDVYIASLRGKDGQEDLSRTKDISTELVDRIISSKDIIVNMIDLKAFDDYTYYHSVNVAVLSIILGVSLNFMRSELYKLGLSALLHDIGKVFIDKNIIEKKGKLNGEEIKEIQKHPTLGYEYLKKRFDIPSKSYLGALQHQERFDGSGYPDGLEGSNISMFGRIIAVADVYDALTSDRPYRKAMLPSEAMEYVMGGAGSLFDPELVFLFTRRVAAYPLGTCVRLSNGRCGIILKNYEDCCMRPRVRLIDTEPPEIVDLKNDRKMRSVIITEIVKI